MDVVRPQFALRAPEYRDSRLFRYSYLENPPNSVFGILSSKNTPPEIFKVYFQVNATIH